MGGSRADRTDPARYASPTASASDAEAASTGPDHWGDQSSPVRLAPSSIIQSPRRCHMCTSPGIAAVAASTVIVSGPLSATSLRATASASAKVSKVSTRASGSASPVVSTRTSEGVSVLGRSIAVTTVSVGHFIARCLERPGEPRGGFPHR